MKWIFLLLSFSISLDALAQACPACSNPALQSSERLEAGLDTLKPGNLRISINLTSGFDYQGGHPNNRGLTTDNILTAVPNHEHLVGLDFLRFETSLELTVRQNWTLWFRIPYDIKSQKADIFFPNAVTEEENQAILRNRDIHHRNETYQGISDLKMLISRRINGVMGRKGRLDVAIGLSVPTGKVQSNPLAAGDIGEKHLHIQFGAGTFDPLLELHYATFLSGRWSFGAYTINRISLYENDMGYQGSAETTTGVSLGYQHRPWVSFRGTFANFTQSSAQWEGKEDPNSGLFSFNGSLTTTFTLNKVFVSPGYRFPIYQRTLSSEGDTFEYGPTFTLNVSRRF